ncbi:hypothetical protein BKA63DRAFT_485138 [Paraphoma chrysanthemicola]|nr:hypothetical protein BKA63DRAFT_485138 [Paraphoma chrysanthemicola]
MASPAPVPAEQANLKPSFAKVAAAALTPRSSKEAAPKARPPVATPRNLALPQIKRSTPAKPEATKVVMSDQAPMVVTGSIDAPKTSPANAEASRMVTTSAEAPKSIADVAGAPKVVAAKIEAPNPAIASAKREQSDDKAGTAAARTGAWTDTAIQSAAPSSDIKADGREKAQPVALVKLSVAEDNGTQLSSSDGSGKPPSIDGKSVASATTFALDEKESLRPDDSASLRAVEEEDVISPPDSIMADSRHGSDNGAARAFRDQLHEIAVMTGQPHRGPPVRFPNALNGTQGLYDPSQPPNGAGVMSQPIVNGAPQLNGDTNADIQPDPRLLDLNPRDRLFIAKIETDFIDFIKEARESVLDLPNCNAFYRMLAHRLAEYYGLNHDTDTTMNTVKITRTPRSRIPPPVSQMGENSKGASTPPVEVPVRVILRRDDAKSGNNTTSNSQNPSGPTSEVGGSEDGQDGTYKGKNPANMTREEREKNYFARRAHYFPEGLPGESENTDGTGGGEEKSKETSRSSSAAGKKKNGRKPRNTDDDDFQARSHYNVYYPSPYSVSGYGNETAVYYSTVGSTVPNSPYSSMTSGPTPPHYGSPPSYHPMMTAAPQSQFGWPGQQYQPPPGPSMYPGYGPMQNGYDLSGEFQRGMSFQNTGNPSQVTPRMGNVPMASFPNSPQQPHNMPMNPSWPQMPQQQAYPPLAPGLYAPSGSNERPTSAPQQHAVNNPYPYGNLPNAPYNFGPNNNQHPIPGSYNRQQFNPQTQAFVPGGRSGPPYGPAMVGPTPQHNSGQHQYAGYQMPMNNNHQANPFHPPGVQTPSFGSPQSMHGNSSSSAMHRNMSQPGAASSIAKYGTPAHLPAKPPAPAVISKRPDHLPGEIRTPESSK